MSLRIGILLACGSALGVSPGQALVIDTFGTPQAQVAQVIGGAPGFLASPRGAPLPADLTHVTGFALAVTTDLHPGSDVGVRFFGTVPEPASALLVSLGLAGLAARARPRAR